MSYIVLPAEKVRDLAQRALNGVVDRRRSAVHAYMEKQMTRWINRWSSYQTVYELEMDKTFGRLWKLTVQEYDRYETCWNLLRASQSGVEQVYVSVEDYEAIS